MLGFGTAQLVYGPVSDGTGRRPALIAGIGIYLAGSVLAMLAPSFEVLLLARAIQGIGGAAGRCSRWRSCATATRAATWPG